MELLLINGLEHQQKAVDAVADALKDLTILPPDNYYSNPIFPWNGGTQARKWVVSEIQQANHVERERRAFTPPTEIKATVKKGKKTSCNTYNLFNLDIKMETGTGKTFVYTKTIYELNKRYGINKFVVIVPTLPIKSGAREFIGDNYTQNFFSETCGYGTEIKLCELQAFKGQKKGRSYMPSSVREYVSGSCQSKDKIYVLLLNMQLLSGSTKMLSRDDYEGAVEGFFRPFDAIRATHPFVIIDEPHKFDRNNKAYQTILNEIQPQCIIRYGATFPERERKVSYAGQKAVKEKVTDFQNLLYELSPSQAFTQGLIKGITKEHLALGEGENEKIRITAIEDKQKVILTLLKPNAKAEKGITKKSYTLEEGESLSMLSPMMSGLSVESIGKGVITLSNGMEKRTGEEIVVSAFAEQYQEQMLRLAIRRHLETEWSNFNRAVKIKTLALFFIDSIDSYRGEHPWLKEAFERQLKNEITGFLQRSDINEEYKDFLRATLADIPASEAAYFAQDNNDSDDAIANEIEVILHGKKQLLSFTKEDGTPNTCRFLFSKWTLKEGWDNPNVFTIAKLRSSGSDISRMQEVGRGLRLPVDEKGNRVSNEDFSLNYIVDFTEADFAKRLVAEIELGADRLLPSKITDRMLIAIGKARGLIKEGDLCDNSDVMDEILIEMKRKGLIKSLVCHDIPDEEAAEQLMTEYPELTHVELKDKIRDRNMGKGADVVKVRKAQFDELRELWQKLNQKYVLSYTEGVDEYLDEQLADNIITSSIFDYRTITSNREHVGKKEGKEDVTHVSETGVTFRLDTKPMPYGLFLQRISRSTSIPITSLHKAMCKVAKEHGDFKPDFINEDSATRIIESFRIWKETNLQQKVRYRQTSYLSQQTALTYKDGQVKESIAQGLVGIHIDKAMEAPDKYLYDTVLYDSDLEKKDIRNDVPQEVIVYGKIPRKSIAIPTIAGSSYSPDFMYVVKRASGEKELNVVLEVKDVENETDLRGEERVKISCAHKFFEQMRKDGYNVRFIKQLQKNKISRMIEELLDR